MRILVMAAVVALAVMGLWVAHVGADENGSDNGALEIAPPDSKSYGKTLTEWNTIYWERTLTGGKSKAGRAQLLPMPAGEYAGGSGTLEDPIVIAGELEVTLKFGTPFVLSLFAWIGERYEDGSEDPTIPDNELIALIHPNLTIDGETVISDDNKADFYIGPTWFDPAIEYPEPSGYGSVAAIWFQGFGVVSLPVPEGVYEMHLWEPFTLPGYPYLVYDNTWIIKVVDDVD